MPCFKPLHAFRAKRLNPSGKRGIVFKRNDGFTDMPLTIPCGQCIGCRLERARQWAVRCVHEASLHDKNCFITLTFNPEHLDSEGSLRKSDYQKFMKRLRKRFGGNIRYFHCGEYGDKNQRPHHHACLFNFDFPDKKLFRDKHGVKLYTSLELQKLWPYGFSTIGDVTYDSAAYVARYVTKKITGKLGALHYNTIDPSTGEILNEKVPEYITMSLKPAIGKEWYEKYANYTYDHDHCIIRSKPVKPPKYYDRLFEIDDPDKIKQIKLDRKNKALTMQDDNTTERLWVKEQLARRKNKDKQQRSFENGKGIHSL